MSLLMPEYERQLRAAARRLAGDPAASVEPSRGGLGSRLGVVLTSFVAVAVAVAVAAIVLIGHHSPAGGSPAIALPAVQYDCAPHETLRTKGQLVPIAHGQVAGQRWTLEVDDARRGLGRVQAGRFLLGGRAYGFCNTGLDVEMINAGPHGVVYGLAAQPYRPPITIEATTAHGTPAHPMQAHNYPTTARQVRGGTFFVGTLPDSACAYPGLGVSAPQRSTIVGATQTTLGMAGTYARACAPGQLRQNPQQRSDPNTLQIGPPPGLSARARTEFDAGRAEVASAGCAACHQIGLQGNNGPGPNLTHIGSLLNPRALESTLVNPTVPMPSFRAVPRRERRAIVAFLHDLR